MLDFCAVFGTSSGLRPEALTPIYGSAEHFGVSMKRLGELPRILRVDATCLEDEGVAVEVSSAAGSEAEVEAPSSSLATTSGSSAGLIYYTPQSLKP